MNRNPGEDPAHILFRIAQVSDCHLFADSGTLYRGENPDANLESLIKRVRAWGPHLVLATGDLSDDGSKASYVRLVEHLSGAGAPIVALPGNHDDPTLMSEFFPCGPWREPFVFEAGNWQIIALDSAVPGLVEGGIDDGQLAALTKRLYGPSEFALVALHHQPVPVNSPWIDKYGLERPEALLAVLDASPKPRALIWGHIHHAFETQRNGMRLMGGPSSVANSKPAVESFTPDGRGPACRWLELADTGRLDSGLLYAFP